MLDTMMGSNEQTVHFFVNVYVICIHLSQSGTNKENRVNNNFFIYIFKSYSNIYVYLFTFCTVWLGIEMTHRNRSLKKLGVWI